MWAGIQLSFGSCDAVVLSSQHFCLLCFLHVHPCARAFGS